jgi:solute carrier family 13 (sodium-dependent dicarboxylate transporter), member 2/3/5
MTTTLETITPAEQKFECIRRTISLFLGPVLFAVVLVWPMPSLSWAAHDFASVIVWVLVYWIGEPIPIPATALLGPTLCVLLGIAGPTVVFAPFAHPIIFLFIGSFLIAEGMIVHQLNQRIALFVLSPLPGFGWLAESPELIPALRDLAASDWGIHRCASWLELKDGRGSRAPFFLL